MNKKMLVYVFVYLVSIAAANLLLHRFGAVALYINSFFLIGLDLTIRDAIHIESGARWRLLFLLVIAGSVLTWTINTSAGRVAVASAVAFLISGISDTLIFQRLRRYNYFVRINGSNVAASILDSVVFPTLAFGVFSLITSSIQSIVKIAGGFLWGLVLRRYTTS